MTHMPPSPIIYTGRCAQKLKLVLLCSSLGGLVTTDAGTSVTLAHLMMFFSAANEEPTP